MSKASSDFLYRRRSDQSIFLRRNLYKRPLRMLLRFSSTCPPRTLRSPMLRRCLWIPGTSQHCTARIRLQTFCRLDLSTFQLDNLCTRCSKALPLDPNTCLRDNLHMCLFLLHLPHRSTCLPRTECRFPLQLDRAARSRFLLCMECRKSRCMHQKWVSKFQRHRGYTPLPKPCPTRTSIFQLRKGCT